MTYEGNHAADQFGDSIQTISPYDLFIRELGTEREVSESQEVDVLVVRVISLNETLLALRLPRGDSCAGISGKRRAERS